jgi:hypothetical protein
MILKQLKLDFLLFIFLTAKLLNVTQSIIITTSGLFASENDVNNFNPLSSNNLNLKVIKSHINDYNFNFSLNSLH